MATNSPLFIELGQGLSLMTGLPTINSWGDDNRPEEPKKGTIGFNTETYQLEYFDGSGWYGVALSKA